MKQKKTDSAYWWRHLSYGLIIGIVLCLLVYAGFSWFQHIRANQLVRECRNVWLSCRLAAIEHYGDPEGLFDEKSQSGLRPIIEAEVRKQSQCDGFFKILSWNQEQNAPGSMEYISEPYVVEFRYSDGVRQWEVYRKDCVLTLGANVG